MVFIQLLFALSTISLSIYSMEPPQVRQDEGHNSQIFHGTPIKELEAVFTTAPTRVKNIVRHLENPHFMERPRYRAAFFVGQTGTGKTVLAKAIAYKAQRDLHFVPSVSLLSSIRNQSAEKLRNRFDTIERTKQPCVLVIDDINLLLENYENPDYDTAVSASALLECLERQHANHNFFLIGTMIRAEKIPTEVKHHPMIKTISIEPITDPNIKRSIFIQKITSPSCILDEEINDEYLDKIISRLPGRSTRMIKSLASSTVMTYRIEDQESKILHIKKKHIDRALEKIIKTCREMKYEE